MITNLIFTSIASAAIIIICCTEIPRGSMQLLAISALSIIIIAATFLEMYSSWISSEKRRKEYKDKKDNNEIKLFSIISRAQEIIQEYLEKEKINDIKVSISVGNTDKNPEDWILTSVVDYTDKEDNDKSKYIELGPINDIETSMNNLISEIEIIRLSLNV